MKKIIFIIIFFITCFNISLFSQTRDEMISRGIDYIYKLKFDSSNSIFQSMTAKDPKDPTGYFFIAMQDWWRVNINREDQTNDDRYFKSVEKVLQLCDEKLDNNERDAWILFLKGGTLGYRGFLNSLRDSWLKAADDGRDGLSLIQKSYELDPANKDAVFGIGLYNYAADYVFEAYPFLKALMLFFPRGNKELGLSQLRDCAENGRFSKTEANFVLGFINLTYEKNYYEAEKYASKLYALYPENPVFEKFLGKSYAGEGKWNESLLIWKDISGKIDSGKFGYTNRSLIRETNYYLGLTFQKMHDLDNAEKNYQKSLDLSKDLDKSGESPYQVFSALGLGMINDLKGNRGEALKFYDRVLDMKDTENSHEFANRFKDNPYR